MIFESSSGGTGNFKIEITELLYNKYGLNGAVTLVGAIGNKNTDGQYTYPAIPANYISHYIRWLSMKIKK